MRAATRRAPQGDAAVALLVGAVAALVAARPLRDNSFFTHLATGRLLVGGDFPRENPFLWTGTSFPMPSWWWSGVLGLVDAVAGAAGLRLLAGVLAGLLGALLVRLTRARVDAPGAAAGPPRTLLAVVAPPALTLFALFPFLNTRPQLAGYLLLGVTVLVWWERRSPWWLVAVMATWVNTHGTWLYGVMVVGLLVVAETVDARRLARRSVELVGAAVLGTLVGAAAYPDRFELLLLPARQFGDPVERAAIRAYREWAPLRWDQPVGWALAALVAAALWGCVRHRRWATTAVVVVLCVLGVSSARMVPVAAVALVPFAAVGLDGLGTLGLPRGRSAAVVSAVAGVLVVAGGVLAVSTDGYDLSAYPVAAVDWMAERDLVADPAVDVVSHDYVGNYLELRFGDRARAWVDDRPDARTLLDYGELRRLDPGWRSAFDRADPDVVLWESGRALPRAVADLDGWEVAHRADGFVVLCRETVADRCGVGA